MKGEEGMLKDMHWKYVNVISSGSVYPFQSGKQTMAFAFYYKVAKQGAESSVRQQHGGIKEKSSTVS